MWLQFFPGWYLPMRFVMNVQLIFSVESFTTHNTWEAIVSCVNRSVTFSIWKCSEGFGTILAFVPDTCVVIHVSLVLEISAESLYIFHKHMMSFQCHWLHHPVVVFWQVMIGHFLTLGSVVRRRPTSVIQVLKTNVNKKNNMLSKVSSFC